MTTLIDRPNTALIVIDVQNGVVAEAWERDAVVANVAAVVDKARGLHVPIIWVQDSSATVGTDAWQIVPELQPSESEAHVEKDYADAFEETTLESVLADAGVGSVVIAGAQTDECIRSTLHGALVRGYDVTLVGDAHTTEDLTQWGAPTPDKVIAHTNLYWGNHKAPGRTAAVVDTKDVTFG